jgi:hypothetical protein
LYTSSGVPTKGRPYSRNVAGNPDWLSYTIPTTVTGGDAGSRAFLIPVRSGKRIVTLQFDSAALSASDLDMDIVLQTTNAAGTTTTTILYNAGTAFTGALAGKWIYCDVQVPEDADGVGHIVAYVNTTGTTPAAGAISLFVFVS